MKKKEEKATEVTTVTDNTTENTEVVTVEAAVTEVTVAEKKEKKSARDGDSLSLEAAVRKLEETKAKLDDTEEKLDEFLLKTFDCYLVPKDACVKLEKLLLDLYRHSPIVGERVWLDNLRKQLVSSMEE